jgi:hypothetical protein
MAGNNRIMIFGPKSNGTYVVEFRTAGARRWQSRSLQARRRWSGTFQERMPYGLFVPDLQEPK